MTNGEVLENISHFPVLLVLSWAIYRKFFSKKPVPSVITVPVRVIRMVLIVLTFGLLAGCSNSDSLAVANGPVFALNAGHWQPTQQDLAAPPAVTDK